MQLTALEQIEALQATIAQQQTELLALRAQLVALYAKPDKLLWTPGEAAESLGFTFSAFNQSKWKKEILVCKVGNLNRYRPQDVKVFADNLPRSYPR